MAKLTGFPFYTSKGENTQDATEQENTLWHGRRWTGCVHRCRSS